MGTVPPVFTSRLTLLRMSSRPEGPSICLPTPSAESRAMRSWLRSCMLFCLVMLMAARSVAAAPANTILLLGDSLSAAHNIELDKGWPSLLQARLRDMRPPRTLINASISGETTASGLSRLPDLLKTYRPALVIIELGANDGLRGLPLSEIRANLDMMIKQCRGSGARVLLQGIELDSKAMQEDGLHPTAAAQPRLLDNVWPALAPMLE